MDLKNIEELYNEAKLKSGKRLFEDVLPLNEALVLLEQLDRLLLEYLKVEPNNTTLLRFLVKVKVLEMKYNEASIIMQKIPVKEYDDTDKAMIEAFSICKDLIYPSKEELNKIPSFKYHPDPIRTGAFSFDKEVVCFCCKNKTNIYYSSPIYGDIDDDIELCPQCIASGKASKELDIYFVDEDAMDDNYDEKSQNILFNRTPGYLSWQEPVWLSHCNEPCAYVRNVGWDDIKDKLDEFIDLEADCEKAGGLEIDDLPKYLSATGSCRGYLFQCVHCRKYRLYYEFD
jgi:uncharacterized protein CbrC (UPF0167 family)